MDLARELKKQWNVKVKSIPLRIRALGTIPKIWKRDWESWSSVENLRLFRLWHFWNWFWFTVTWTSMKVARTGEKNHQGWNNCRRNNTDNEEESHEEEEEEIQEEEGHDDDDDDDEEEDREEEEENQGRRRVMRRKRIRKRRRIKATCWVRHHQAEYQQQANVLYNDLLRWYCQTNRKISNIPCTYFIFLYNIIFLLGRVKSFAIFWYMLVCCMYITWLN